MRLTFRPSEGLELNCNGAFNMCYAFILMPLTIATMPTEQHKKSVLVVAPSPTIKLWLWANNTHCSVPICGVIDEEPRYIRHPDTNEYIVRIKQKWYSQYINNFLNIVLRKYLVQIIHGNS